MTTSPCNSRAAGSRPADEITRGLAYTDARQQDTAASGGTVPENILAFAHCAAPELRDDGPDSRGRFRPVECLSLAVTY